LRETKVSAIFPKNKGGFSRSEATTKISPITDFTLRVAEGCQNLF